jgi:hypothetical protein
MEISSSRFGLFALVQYIIKNVEDIGNKKTFYYSNRKNRGGIPRKI